MERPLIANPVLSHFHNIQKISIAEINTVEGDRILYIHGEMGQQVQKRRQKKDREAEK